MIGCTSKEKEVTFSKTSQDIWGDIIINDMDKISVTTTLEQLGKDYSFNDVKVKGDGYVATSLEKEKFYKIQVIVNEKELQEYLLEKFTGLAVVNSIPSLESTRTSCICCEQYWRNNDICHNGNTDNFDIRCMHQGFCL